MKNLKYLVLSVLFCSLVGSAIAQSTTRDYDDRRFRIGYECDGVRSLLTGEVNIHLVTHYNPKSQSRRPQWTKMMVHGEMTDRVSGEIFRVNYNRKIDYSDRERTTHYNLVGDMGTHVIYSITYGYDENGNYGILDEKAKCI